MTEHRIFLGLGTNLGDRWQNMAQAQEAIENQLGAITKVSSMYSTKAWGIQNQPDFLNQVLESQTNLSPTMVLENILQIERDMGRERRIKWGARLIDIDILFYDDQIIQTPELTIPHPHLHERNFVLIPLAEIAPDFYHPFLKSTIKALADQTVDRLGVRKLT